MAQIWLTYQELAEFLGETLDMSREGVIQSGWARRRSRDGVTRVKLPRYAASYFLAYCLMRVSQRPDVADLVALLRFSDMGLEPDADRPDQTALGGELNDRAIIPASRRA